MRTAVVVLGDLGRSPRMQYHALALAVNAGDVDLVGLSGTSGPDLVGQDPRIHVHHVGRDRGDARPRRSRRASPLPALRRASQSARLFVRLLALKRPDVVLIQAPPSPSALAAAWMAARVRGARLVVDWHNLPHTALVVALGDDHRAVRARQRRERRWARRADAHLAASQGLAAWLGREYGVTPTVVPDRPPAGLGRTEPAAADALWARLARDHRLDGRRRPLVVCPTRWTLAEDFDLLLEAAERAERELAATAPSRGDGPDLVLMMTGEGPLRAEIEARLTRRALQRLAVRTLWLDRPDFRALLGMADAGLCLHQSTSGLDLPTRLADFRGATLPALAYDYAPVLAEAVTAGQEGVPFSEAGELAALFVALGTRDLDRVPAFAASRAWLSAHPPERWEDVWRARAFPVLAGKP